jgi:Holliday junction resolvasome RuvABC endonuclease subunit
MSRTEKVRILAFDPGTANMGYAIIEGNMSTGIARLTAHHGVLKTSKKDGDIRTRADILGNEVKRLIQCFKPDYVVIEDYTEQGVKSGTTYKDMSILIENMRGVCTTMKRVPDIWTNAFWKKLATGSSGLKKHQIQHFVQHKVKGTELLGSRASDTHVWDAAGIAYAKFLQLQGEQ